jgi:SnoaL-like domain
VTLTKPQVAAVLEVYLQAWETQDPALIVGIFAEGATYHERVLGAPIRGRDGIGAYWRAKVVAGQANITARLLALYWDREAQAATAEWEASFDDTAQGVRKRMREVAILTFDGGGLITSLREYWASEELGQLAPADRDGGA